MNNLLPPGRIGVRSLANSLDEEDDLQASQHRPRPEYRTPLPAEQAAGYGKQLADAGLSGLNYVFSALDKPGRAVRGVLGGKTHELAAAIPFSDSLGLTNYNDQVTGRDLTNKIGLTEKRDKGWGAWGAGIGAEILTDPLSYLSFGTSGALTQAGKAAAKAGKLKTLTRAERISQGLSGLVGVGLPFRDPSIILGTGPKAAALGGAIDKGVHAAAHGNAVGRYLGANFDYARRGAKDYYPGVLMSKYGTPAREAAQAVVDKQHYQATALLRDAKRAAPHADEMDILNAALKHAEGVPLDNVAPDIAAAAQPLGLHARSLGPQWLNDAIDRGLRLKSSADQFAPFYAPRAAVSIEGHNPGLRPLNLFPTKSSANLKRQDPFRRIPGGTGQIQDWVRQHAAHNPADTPMVAASIYADMVDKAKAMGIDLLQPSELQIPNVPNPTLFDEFRHHSEGLADWLAKLSPGYKKTGYFDPNLIGNLERRGLKHAETVGSSEAIYGGIRDYARPMSELPPGSVSVPDFLRAMELTTLKADKKTGTPMRGAAVKAYEILHPGQPLPGKGGYRSLRKKLSEYGFTPDFVEQMTRGQKQWQAATSAEGPLDALRSFTNAFRGLAYSVWPASHIRNLGGGLLNNAIAGADVGSHVDMFRLLREGLTPDQVRKYIPSLPGNATPEQAMDALRETIYSNAGVGKGHNAATDLAGKSANILQGRSVSPKVPLTERAGPTGNFAGDVGNLIKEGLLGRQGTKDQAATSIRDIFGMAGVGGGPLDNVIDTVNDAAGKPILNKIGLQSHGAPRTEDTFAPLAAGRIAGANIEDFLRGSLALSKLKQGHTAEAAGDLVRKYHFDYGRLAPFEAKVMRTLVPFYTFARGNLPLQLDLMKRNPTLITNQLRATRTTPDQYTPEYLSSGIAIPLGKEQNGLQRYISQLGLPVEEAFERWKFKNNRPDPVATSLAYAAGLNPVIKGPLEQLFDRQFHTNRNLSDLHPSAFGKTIESASQGYLGDDSARFWTQAIANTPLTRFMTAFDKLADPRKGALEKATNLLSGVRVTDVDAEKLRAVETRQALQELLKAQPHLASYTNFYVRPEDAGKLTPDEIQQMRMLALLQQKAREHAAQVKREGQQ